MIRPKAYLNANNLQRCESLAVFRDFLSQTHWAETDTFLDIGCGPADITVEILKMVNGYREAVGMDISPAVINFTKKRYAKQFPNLKFEMKDIGDSSNQFIDHFEKYDHITSFFTLHWTQNQR